MDQHPKLSKAKVAWIDECSEHMRRLIGVDWLKGSLDVALAMWERGDAELMTPAEAAKASFDKFVAAGVWKPNP